jgi:hypothetical protein
MKFLALIKRFFCPFKGVSKLENPDKILEHFLGYPLPPPNNVQLRVKEDLLSLGHVLGLDFESLLSSFELAKKGVDDSNPKIQYAAIQALNYFWPKDEQVAEKCMTVLQSNADEGVKGASISYLLHYYDRASKEDPIVRLLARIVSGKDHADIKSFAYLGMESLLYGFRLKDDPLTFSFPRDVDWKLVKKLAGEERQPE